MKQSHEPARIGVVIYPGVEPIDLGATVGVVSMATRALPRIAAAIIAETPGPVLLAGGMTVLADHGFAENLACDITIVCGGPGWREQVSHPPMLEFLRRQPARCTASVCTGALILAAAGLLDGRRATTRRHAAGAEAQSPLDLLPTFGQAIQPQTAVLIDDVVVTGGGVSLAIDTTLYLIGRLYGEPARDEVARIIEYDRAWAANQQRMPQPSHRLEKQG